MSVPNTFATATSAIPLANLDANFAYYDAAYSISGSAVTFIGSITLNSGTANGVVYLNGSKVATSGTALTFDGTKFEVSSATGSVTPTPTEVRISTTTSAGGWSTTLPWGRLGYYSADTSTFGPKLQASIDVISNAASGGAASIIFNTVESSAGALTERMRISNIGDVGIGTASPARKLDVNGAVRIADANVIEWGGTTTSLVGSSSSNTMQFFTASSERMRLDSTGNLGIGTTSPTVPLTVGDSTAPTGLTPISVMISTNTSSGQVLNVRKSCDTALGPSISLMKSRGTAASPVVANVGDTAGGVIYSAFAGTNYRQLASINGAVEAYVSDTNISGYLVFNTNSASTGTAEKMRLDASGNLGLGVTPSAWNSAAKAIQISTAATFWGLNNNQAYIGSNSYYDTAGAFRYIVTDYATQYRQWQGTHNWYNAPSGTAGNAITFTQAMTLDASGNLGVGTTSPGAKLDVRTSLSATSGVQNIANFYPITSGATDATYGGRITIYTQNANNNVWPAAIAAINDNGGSNLSSLGFYTATAGPTLNERMRLDASGNLGIGTTTPATKLDVGGTSQAYGFRVQSATNLTGAGIWGLDTTLAFNTNSTEKMRLDASGNLLVGTTSGITSGGVVIQPVSGQSTVYIGHITGTGSGASYAEFYYAGTKIGSITQSGTTAVLYNVTSDQRLKENIQDAAPASALIDAIQVRQYDWKSDGSHQRYGFVAQELVTVAPEAVHQPADPEEMMAVDYSKLVPMLVKEIQDLRKRLAALEAK